LITTLVLSPFVFTWTALCEEEEKRFEEVLVSDIAEPKRPGELWIGAKPSAWFGDNANAGTSSFILETGIISNLGVELSIPVHSFNPSAGSTVSGFGDLEFGVKYDLIGDTQRDYAFALGLEACLPTGKEREGFSELKYELGVVALLSARTGQIEWHLGTETAFVPATKDVKGMVAEDNPEQHFHVAAHYGLREGLGLLGEFRSGFEYGEGGARSGTILGLWWEPVERIEIGLGGEIPFGSDTKYNGAVLSAFWFRF